jgi:CHAD domain-containing protein
VTTEAEPAAAAEPAREAQYEVELKYEIGSIDAGRELLAADEIAGLTAIGPLMMIRLSDRYVDTRGGVLARAGWACRVRETGSGTLISLKGLTRRDTGGALHRREELEGTADLSRPPASWEPSRARDVLLELVGGQSLAELVTLNQVRHQRHYARDGVEVELSADDVEVMIGGRAVDRFVELEAELRAGAEDALEPLIAWLDEHEALVAVEGSKLERALDAARRSAADQASSARPQATASSLGTPDGVKVASPASPASPTRATAATAVSSASAPTSPVADTPTGAPTPTVTPTPTPGEPATPRILVPKSPGVLADDHLAEAGRKVLRFHLARMVAREQATRDSEDPEELHGMRVATRRQRAAWRVFGDAFEPKRTARYRRRLRRVASDLGAVRDLDVLIDSAKRYQARQSRAEAAALEPLIDEWQARRNTARVVLLSELDSDGYRRWLDGYLAFVQAEGQGVHAVGPTQPHRVRDTMPSRIWSAYEAVRAYEAVMRWADVATLHDLRIAAKWLRYTLEFVREALGRDAGPAIAKVVALQDHLGWLHDADVAAGLARAFLVEHAGDLTEHESAAIGRYLVDRERELGRLRRTVGQPWRGLSSLAYRRALGKLVAGL